MWRLEPVFFGAVCFRVVYSQVKWRIVRHQSCFPVTFHGKFCTPSQDLVHHQLKTFSGKLQTFFLSVDHSKLQIFVTLWVLTCFTSHQHKSLCSWQPRIPKNVVQPNSIQQKLTRGNSKHIIFVQYIDFLVSDCHSGFVLVPWASFLQLLLFSL